MNLYEVEETLQLLIEAREDVLISETWKFERWPLLREIQFKLKQSPVPGAKMSPNGNHLEVK